MPDTEELEVPGSVELADEDRDKIGALKEVVIGDHVKQEILVQAGDSEAIARRLGQRTQASLTYPAEEQDAKNIADEDIFEIEEKLKTEREEAEAAKAAEIEEEGAASAKANEEAAGKSVTQQTMDAHDEATGGAAESANKIPSTHAELDALAAEEGVDISNATTVADKQAAILEARGA